MTTADPTTCFKKPRVLDYDNKKYWFCEATACLTLLGWTYWTGTKHVGMFSSAELAEQQKQAHDAFKSATWQLKSVAASDHETLKPAPKAAKTDKSMQTSKPVYHAFISKKAGKSAYDTEYIGKCTDVIGAIHRLQGSVSPTELKDLDKAETFSLIVHARSQGSTISITSKTSAASQPQLYITDAPDLVEPKERKLVESMHEAKLLKRTIQKKIKTDSSSPEPAAMASEPDQDQQPQQKKRKREATTTTKPKASVKKIVEEMIGASPETVIAAVTDFAEGKDVSKRSKSPKSPKQPRKPKTPAA